MKQNDRESGEGQGSFLPMTSHIGLSDRYTEINRQFTTRLVFQLGLGGGFCAEMIYLLKTCLCCLSKDVQFTLGQTYKPKGYATASGWADYFVPVFPEVSGKVLSLLNRSSFPLGRYSITKYCAGGILRWCYRDRKHYFMCDSFPQYIDAGSVSHKLGMEGDYWQVIQTFIDAMWVYQDDVRKALDEYAREYEFDFDQEYVGIHIRRGDKIVDGPYTRVERYADILRSNGWESLPIYIATDDSKVINEFREVMGCSPQILSFVEKKSGHYQNEFNSMSPRTRRDETLFFLFELEVLKNSLYFIGAAPSNIYYWLRYLRGNSRMENVGSSG